ncbi:MAG: exodeoxyribonuclease VII large subunit [Pseudomonadota bacterium]
MTDLFEDETPSGSNAPEFTVSEIAGQVRKLIEGELGWVRVRGEVGRVFRARSGHLYFDLKDDKSVLSCMTWKGQIADLGLEPEEGMEVFAEGKMTASGMQSKFGLNVQRLAVAGEGALMAMLERRKKALAAEGLFAEERKRPLPYLPDIVGVITSPQGAVIRDILHRLRDRFPRKVLIWPVAVQGAACAPEVARAIQGFNALTPGGSLPRPDVLIVARGGGSIEDLWGFNEEVVARAAAASNIPLISAVGHETDTTLIDFVSDRRAPTPTAAAEMAVPVRLDLIAWVEGQDARLARAASQGIERRKQRLTDLSRLLPRREAILNDARQRLDLAEQGLSRALDRMVERKRAGFEAGAARFGPTLLRSRFAQAEQGLRDRSARLRPVLARALQDRSDRLGQIAGRLRPAPLRDRLSRNDRELTRLAGQTQAALTGRMSRLTDRLDALDRMRRSLGYQATLSRGYAVVRKGDTVVTGAADARAAALEIEFKDGRVDVVASEPPSRGTKPAKPKDDQGSLF